jgi:predicted permease
MGAFLHDLRYGLRMLVKHPGLAGISVLAFGLGLGLTATMWSINYGVLMRGLPFEDADRITAVNRTIPERDIDRINQRSILDYDAINARQTSFEALAAWYAGTINVSGSEGRPERYRGAFVTPNGFGMLGVRPLLGRFFTDEEGAYGGPRAVILGYDLWRNRFHGERAVIGRAIRVNAEPASVVGVMPEGFKFPMDEALWLPLRANRVTETRQRVNVYGKLKPGVSVDRAMQEFTALEAGLTREFPETNRGIRPLIELYHKPFLGPEPTAMLWTMMGAVVAVLLIACSNVANLLLARAAVRTKEVAVRTALGASRWRIVSQLLAEALVLAAAGGAVGIGIAVLGARWFEGSIRENQIPFWIDITVDAPVVLFLGGVTVLCAVVSGVLPALQATGTRIHEVLKDESRGASSLRLGRFSKGLVVVEIALSCGLLIAAGFMIESVVRRSRFDYGIPTRNVFTARIGLFEAAHPDSADRQRFWRDVVTRLETHPGQAGVALATGLPGLGTGTRDFAIEGGNYPTERDYPAARFAAVSPGFFRTFQITPREGRVFTDADIGGAQPVAIVTENFAARHFPGTSALGRRIRLGGGSPGGPWSTIIGVIPSIWLQGTDEDTPEGLLVPMLQGDYRFLTVAVASSGPDPMTFADVVRREVAGVDPDQPIYFEGTLQQRIEDDGWYYSVFGVMFMVFGFAALLLATIGVYGVMSFAVTRRTQEVGVRMALGAGRMDVLRLFLQQGAVQVALGVTLGLGLAIALAKGLRIVLFQVDTTNPLMFAGVIAALAATGMVAILIPARRATRVDPVVALRYE